MDKVDVRDDSSHALHPFLIVQTGIPPLDTVGTHHRMSTSSGSSLPVAKKQYRSIVLPPQDLQLCRPRILLSWALCHVARTTLRQE